MENILLLIIVGIVALAIGVFIGRKLLKKHYSKLVKEANEKSKLVIKEAEITAENIKKDKILEAKEKFLKLKSEFEEESNRKKKMERSDSKLVGFGLSR